MSDAQLEEFYQGNVQKSLRHRIAILTAISLPVDYRIPVSSATISLSEFFAVLFIAVSVGNAKFSPKSVALILLAAIWGMVTYIFSDFHYFHLTAMRNIAVGTAFFAILTFCNFNYQTRRSIVAFFLLSMTACGVLGILQSALGYESAMDIYDILPAQISLDNRLSLLTWKLNELQSSGIFPGQRALAIGLSSFSNGFGEFLVYGILGALCIWREKKLQNFAALVIVATLFAALLLSGSRTSWLGAVVVIGLFLLLTLPKGRLLYVLSALLLPIFVYLGGVLLEYLFFDGGGTVLGRFSLNSHATDIVFSSAKNSLVGGGAEQYLAVAPQVPHSSTLYLALIFGIPAAAAYALVMLSFLVRFLSHFRRTAATGALAALIGGVWFALYGETWAVVSTSNEIMIFAIFAAWGVVPKVRSKHLLRHRLPGPQAYYSSSSALTTPAANRSAMFSIV
jgi:hypothetical protein